MQAPQNVAVAQRPPLSLPGKSLLTVFRSQRIKSLAVELKVADTAMTFTLECGNGLQKTFMVQCMDTEILQASVDKDQFPVTVVAETGEMNKLLSTFQSSLDEIIILCNPDSGSGPGRPKPVQLQSFFDPAKGNTEKALRTQLAIDTHHVFLNYRNTLGEATDVTFNLKDFRCMVQLCEAMTANMVLRFDQPGLPLVVEPHLHSGAIEELQYEAELVLATLMESQASQLQQDAARLATPGNTAAPIAHPLQTPARGLYTPGGLSIPGDTPATHPGASLAGGAAQKPRPPRFTPTQHVPPSASRGPAAGVPMQWERTPAAAQQSTPSRAAPPPTSASGAAASARPLGAFHPSGPQEGFTTPAAAQAGPSNGWRANPEPLTRQQQDSWQRGPSPQAHPATLIATEDIMEANRSNPHSQCMAWESSLAAPNTGVGGACSLRAAVDGDEAAATPQFGGWSAPCAPAGRDWASDAVEQAQAAKCDEDEEEEDEDAIPSTPPEKRLRCRTEEIFGGGISDGDDAG